MSKTHFDLLNIYKKLGYRGSLRGVCHGFSMRWIEACLLGKQEEERFENRIKGITSESSSQIMEEIDCDLIEKHVSSPELLEIRGFFDSLAVFQNSSAYPALFGQEWAVTQQDIEIISTVASSDAILKRGGLKVIYSEPVIYTKAEITSYFDALGKILESVTSLSHEPIGVLLEDQDHTTALKYNSGQGWDYRDINQSPSRDNIADAIMKGFSYNNQSNYSAFNVRIILTDSDKRKGTLQERLEAFNQSHLITEDIAHRSTDEINLAWIAAKCGHFRIIKRLAAHGADFNKVNSKGMTPTWIAANHNQAEAIEALADHKKAATIKTLVAQKNDEFIDALAAYKAVLNQANNEGVTPICIAARCGYVKVINVLAAHGANLNQSSKTGITPAMIATQKADIKTIKTLAMHGADFTQSDNNGVTPLFIAVQSGRHEIVALLLSYGANPKLVCKGTSADLIAFAKRKGNAVVEKMKEFIASQKADHQNKFSLTPFDMAEIMGHQTIVELLEWSHNQPSIKRRRLN